jgi:hypothetical protein
MSGSTVDRPFTARIKSASGKNFTTVSVGPPGGPGVAIVPRQNWAIGQRDRSIGPCSIRWTIGKIRSWIENLISIDRTQFTLRCV